MPIERAADHPTFELGETRITSYAAPARRSDETTELSEGDCVMMPIGVRHALEADPEGCSIVVMMLGGTQMFRDDGIDMVPEWVR